MRKGKKQEAKRESSHRRVIWLNRKIKITQNDNNKMRNSRKPLASRIPRTPRFFFPALRTHQLKSWIMQQQKQAKSTKHVVFFSSIRQTSHLHLKFFMQKTVSIHT